MVFVYEKSYAYLKKRRFKHPENTQCQVCYCNLQNFACAHFLFNQTIMSQVIDYYVLPQPVKLSLCISKKDDFCRY